MRSIEELRRAMRDETLDLAPKVTFAQIRQRARRRRRTLLAAFLAAVLVPAGATVTALAGGPAGPGPGPVPPPARSGAAPAASEFAAGTELPGTGEIVRTGIAYGPDEEFVLRYSGDDMNGVWSGLFNPKTSLYRRLEGGLTTGPGQLSPILEFEDRRGGIVDYGMVGAAGARVELTVDGVPSAASTVGVPGMPGTTLFWVRRTGTAVGPTGAPAGGPTPDLVFTARDATGAVIATGGGAQRSDGAIVIKDTAVRIGDLMPTGVTLADGGKLVLWFAGDDRSTGLFAGSATGGGEPAELRGLGRYNRPPFGIGFYLGRDEFDQPGGTKVVLWVYVGPAAGVTLSAPVSTGHGSVRWSAHPELRIAWISGVPVQDTSKVTGVATDAAGTVVADTKDR